MGTNKTNILVYAHWQGMSQPEQMGVLIVDETKGRSSFSFSYHSSWLESKQQYLLDPDIDWYSGPQFPNTKNNFGIFLDSMPDTWGRTLMKRRAALKYKAGEIATSKLYETDFLLGVFDASRMGALRFKLEHEASFLDDDPMYSIPVWSSIQQLQHGVEKLEQNEGRDDEIKEWLQVVMAPGSSLGGARPKANILDKTGHPWIAKFPSTHDTIDKGLWEFLAYKLAVKAGINMSESSVQKVTGRHHTFFTKRFDRDQGERIHFASAMTMTGNTEDSLKENSASYLDLAEFIQFSGTDNTNDLHQLWKRLVFNILISNTDDHLRNHGFILTNKGWKLSPAYDINPSIDKYGLAININTTSNALDLELAKQVGHYFQLNAQQMHDIIDEVKEAVSTWGKVAKEIGISRTERLEMQEAFKLIT